MTIPTGVFAMTLACIASTAGAAEVQTWSIDAYGPRGRFAEQFRDIDLRVFHYSRAWRVAGGFELSVGGGPWIAQGTRWEPLTSEPPLDSDALGISMGGGARYRFPEVIRLRPFLDASAHFSWAEQPFPARGSAVNGLVRWGGGFELALGSRNSVEFGYRLAHLSNGGPSSVQNPAWDGKGFFAGWRRKL